MSFDPETQPIVPLASAPALPDSTLRISTIYGAFQHQVPWQVDPLSRQPWQGGGSDTAVDDGIRQAAVLMPLVQRADGLHVLFTRRSNQLHHHAGQISFPGGCIEAADRDATAAAIRETHEEIGVDGRYVRVMGTQPALLTTSRFLMTPVIGELLPGFHVLADAREVAEVFEVPLAVLMDPARYRLHRLEYAQGGVRHFFSIRWESYFIWGATAMLLRNFYRFLWAASFSSRIR